ncbi:phosphatase PAP2 family protein [Nakamurella flavida]
MSLLPFSAVLGAYAVAQWVNSGLNADPVAGRPNGLGFPLRVTEPIAADRWLFGRVPTPWLQERLYPDGAAHWWDALVAPVYSSHFVVIPVVGAVLWFRHRDRFRPWVWSVFLLVATGVVLYIVYPMAPPWMAARDGYLEPVQRLSGLGWRVLGLDFLDTVQSRGQQQGNTVAAMPSLHAGAATLVAAFFWAGRGPLARLLLLAYPLAMAFALVLTGEHYVVDALVGILLAVLAVLTVTWSGRRVARRSGTTRT